MSPSQFPQLYAFLEKRRWSVLFALLVLVGLSIASFRFLRLENSLQAMLPSDPELQRDMTFIQEAKFADKVVISFEKCDEGMDAASFLSSVDCFADSLDPALVRRVFDDFSMENAMEDFRFFVAHASEILDERDLQAIDAQLTPEGVDQILHKRYLELLKPEGSFLSPLIRSDPLGIAQIIAQKVQDLTGSFGYRVNLENGHLVHPDARHALLILETPVAITDGNGSRTLVTHLRQRLQSLPATLSADMVCGHTHTVSNEEVIKRDIKITALMATLSFPLVFLFFFKDVRSGLVFLVPFLSVLLAMSLAGIFLGRLAVFVVGLGSLIAGIADDYAIEVYVSMGHASSRYQAIRRVARQNIVGTLTTLSVFIAFAFSGIKGYRQLAFFSVASIGIALILSMFVLPLFLRPGLRPEEEIPPPPPPSRKRIRWSIGLFVGVCAVFLAGSFRLRTNFDLSRMDGTVQAVLDQEEKFFRIWGEGDKVNAMGVSTDPDLSKALEKSDQVLKECRRLLGSERIVSLSSLWPSIPTRREHAKAWERFWSEGREDRLRTLLMEQGKKYGFSDNAFLPFFETLRNQVTVGEEPVQNRIFEGLQERFVRKTPSGIHAILYFPDTEENVRAFAEVEDKIPGAYVVSRRALAGTLSRSITREITHVSLLALVLVVLETLFLSGRLRVGAIALVPAVSSLLAMVGFLGLSGFAFNVGGLIACTVLAGVCVDYGIFMAIGQTHTVETGTSRSVFLASLTTLLGAGVLLFARHPALFSVGVTIVVGILAGSLTALLVVPSLCEVFGVRRSQ